MAAFSGQPTQFGAFQEVIRKVIRSPHLTHGLSARAVYAWINSSGPSFPGPHRMLLCTLKELSGRMSMCIYMCMRHRRERFECERHARERVCIGRPHFVCARRATTIPWRRAGRQDSEGQEHRKPLRRARDGQPNRQRRCVQHRLALPPAARQGKHLVKYTACVFLEPAFLLQQGCRPFSYVGARLPPR